MATRTLRNFINGTYVDAKADESFPVIDPVTEKSYATSPVSSPADVDDAYRAAAAAFEGWGEQTPAVRQLALFRIADELERRADEFADLESQDTGKPRATLVQDEILLSVDQLRFFAGAARNLEGRATAEYMPDHTSSIRREPIGVIGQVTPWNYPLNMAVWKIAPAIAAGNTTVLKPSDTTPQATLLLAEIAAEFLPPGVLNVITGDRTTGGAMIDHKTPQMVSITGSVRAGMEVAKAAANDLKRVHLELGGKAPVIVFPDAEMSKAVEGIAMAGYFNAGQDCTAATRVLVHEDAHDAFVVALVKHVKNNVTTGDPHDAGTFFGPVNNLSQFDRVMGVIGGLPSHAEVQTGGARQGEKGYFIEPTVVSGLNQDDDAVQNEIFGPVITVQRFRDESQAL
ncbi:MAG: gamma-aminobutyraldehyde dehydrogenase, partial [Schumannella sp.]|nr:gamma-aminobutyraldehyde dehydrogenase [Schumannella sp.]